MMERCRAIIDLLVVRPDGFWFKEPVSLEDVPEYFYLQNSDAFPDEAAIEKLVGYLDSHEEFGIAGSYIHGTGGAENDPHTTAFRFPSVASEFEAARNA